MKKLIAAVVITLFISSAVGHNAWAASAREIDAGIEETLERFYEEVDAGKKLVKDAKGVLVFPGVYKAGIVLGGEYGEGALQINGKTVDYYSSTSASIGLQLGAQKKRIVILYYGTRSP